jgi:arabinofuranosyltransferase
VIVARDRTHPLRRAAVGAGELAALALILVAVFAAVLAAPLRAPALAPVAAGRVAPAPAFVDGLYGPEQAADGSTYRWTRGAALVQLRGAFYAAPAYLVELRLRAENPAGPRPLTLLAGGEPAAVVTPEAQFRTYRLLLAPTRASGPELWLALQTPTFEAPVNPRPLGVVLTDVALTPVPRPGLATAAGAALGVLALWALVRRTAAPGADSAREALALAALAALAVAGAAVIYRPAAVPFPWLAALILAGVAGAALLARGAAARLGLAALAAVVALSGLVWPSWLSDDAFISFRYAQNLVQGHGLVYNVGERVEGYTNFLWTVLAAGVIALGGDVALWSHLAGIALGIAVVLLTYALAARLVGGAWGLLAALIVATSQSLLLYSARGSGLETGLFTLLVLAASERYLAAHRRPGALIVAGLLVGLSALTRPEGLMVFGLTAAHLAFTNWRRREATPLLLYSLSFLAIFLPYFLWRVTYYGDLLPNTFYAKTGGGASQVLRGLGYAGGFALTLGGPLLLVVLAPWLRDPRAALASWRGFLLPLALAYTAYIVAVGGDHFRGQRFFVPILPLVAILMADGVATIYAAIRRSRRLPGFILHPAACILLMLLAVAALARTAPIDATMRGLDESVWIWREIGWWMADHTPPDASLAAAGAGAPAFYGQRETIDLYGLTEKHIGRLEVATMGEGVAGHEKRDPAYVLGVRRPTYIPRIWEEYFGGAEALEDDYRLITVATRSGRELQLWERLPAP